MEKCKFCQADLAENGTFCPCCGKNNAESAEPETAPVEEAVQQTEQPAEKNEAPAPAEVKEGVKATPGKLALMVAAIVAVAAVIVALVYFGMSGQQGSVSGDPLPTESQPAETEILETTAPVVYESDNVRFKASYTAADDAVLANADAVVATVGEYGLTNAQLQVLYWMEVQNFLGTYGSYASYIGLDYTQPLDTQACSADENVTWQQFFLQSCLGTWQNYRAMAAEAEKNGFQLNADTVAYLENMETSLEESALSNGFESAEELLAYNVGRGATIQDYVDFMETYYMGYEYFNSLYDTFVPTDAEIEAYFTENEAAYSENGVTRDGKYVDVRHILVMPQGGTTAEDGSTTYSEAEWEACRQEAQAILDQWLAGEKTEDSFAQLANEKTQDGNDADYDGVPDGGLYTRVVKGQMVEPFENWCFDEARQTGDYGLVQTVYGYHVMYFVDGYPIWYTTVKDEMTSNNGTAFVTEVTAQYPLVADYAAMLLGESGLSEE